MSLEPDHTFTEKDFDIRIEPFDAIGHGNEFGYRLWIRDLDRTAGMDGPFKTKQEAFAAGLNVAIAEAKRLNDLL